MLAVEVTVPVVVQVPNHLLRGSLDPLGRLGAGALVPAKGAEVASLGFDDATGVIVGEGVLGVLGYGFGLVEAVTEGPGVGADGGAKGAWFGGLGGLGGRRKQRKEASAGAGEEARPRPLHSSTSHSPPTGGGFRRLHF